MNATRENVNRIRNRRLEREAEGRRLRLKALAQCGIKHNVQRVNLEEVFGNDDLANWPIASREGKFKRGGFDGK